MSLQRWFQPSTGRLEDRALRARKAHKIVTALRREIGDLSALTCLDVGCSAGLITAVLAPHFCLTVGVELDHAALADRDAGEPTTAAFVCGDGERLPVRDGSVEVVVCAQVYEHVANAARLFGEIERVLAPEGVCFLSGPNKWFPIEMHTGLPLIHWLPHPWAVGLARRLGRGEYDARLLTPGTLRRRLAAFGVCDYTATMIRDPEAFACADELGGLAWVSVLPEWALRLLLPLAPNVNWVLYKKGAGHGGD